MTQAEFFSGIEGNLRRLKDARIPLPDCNLPRVPRSLMKAKALKKLTERDPTAPINVRVYDLVSGGLPCIPRQRFRVFAAFVEEPTSASYREVKFRLRKWYQESGWAFAHDRPYAGAMVVGAATTWPRDMTPNADDLPFDGVEFLVLSSPDSQRGVDMRTSGDLSVGAVVFRALGEDFELRKKRVEACVRQLFDLPEIVRDGPVTVAAVAERTGVPEDDVAYIFNDFQGEGKFTVRKARHRAGRPERTPAESTFLIDRPPSWWGRFVSRRQGKWYTRGGFSTILSVGLALMILRFVGDGLKDLALDFGRSHVAIVLCAIGALAAAGCLFLAFRLFSRNR